MKELATGLAIVLIAVCGCAGAGALPAATLANVPTDAPVTATGCPTATRSASLIPNGQESAGTDTVGSGTVVSGQSGAITPGISATLSPAQIATRDAIFHKANPPGPVPLTTTEELPTGNETPDAGGAPNGPFTNQTPETSRSYPCP